MKKAIMAMASLGLITLLVSLGPDIRRYLRMCAM